MNFDDKTVSHLVQWV